MLFFIGGVGCVKVGWGGVYLKVGWGEVCVKVGWGGGVFK